MSWRRVRGMIKRQWWTLKRSLPRVFDVFFWPVVEILVWGLVTLYLLEQLGASFAPGVFIGGMILWIVLYRSQEDLAVSVLEEAWSDNLINLAGSPLKPIEYLTASMIVGFVKTLFAASAMAVLAYVLYGYNLLEIGPTLLFATGALIIFGWSLGLISVGLVLRYGRRVDVLVWSFSHLVQPLACAVYPLSVLPPALQVVAGLLPAAHAFEASRAAIAGQFATLELAIALSSSVVTLMLGTAYCRQGLARARQIGRLATLGE